MHNIEERNFNIMFLAAGNVEDMAITKVYGGLIVQMAMPVSCYST